MPRRPWLLLVALGALAPLLRPQSVAPVRRLAPEPTPASTPADRPLAVVPSGSVVTIGDGQDSHGDFQGDDEQPFVAALAALPKGGTIRVGAGTYRFKSPVVVSTARIVLDGTAASLIASKAPLAAVFHVKADDVEIRGFKIQKLVDNTAFHALVRVESSRVRIRDCRFFGVGTSSAPEFIRTTEDGDERWVQDNSFQPGRGWTCVRAEGGRGMHLTGNSVIGPAGQGLMRYGFHLVNESWSEISGNTFIGLGNDQNPVEAVLLIENTEGEGHHAIVSDNTMHLINARRGIHLAGSQFSVVSGNAIGRLFGVVLEAMLDIDLGPQGVGAKSTTVTGNEFHNSVGAPMVRINGIQGINLTGNQFSLVSTTAVLVGDQAPAERVTIASNSFDALPSVQPDPALKMVGGSGHVVIGNSFDGFLVSAMDTAGVAPAGIVLDLNIEQ